MTRTRHTVLPPQTATMRARDGTALVADIWRPDTDVACPVLLMRQAYGRAIGTSLCYAPPEWYAAHGYIVVIQDVRGRGDSEGAFELFEHEAADGADTVRWAAGLPGANGRVGMFGFSFQGTNQLLALAEKLSELRAIAPAMIGWDLYSDWAYENGAFALRANLGWATQLAAETARLAGDHDAQAALFAASRALGFSGPRPAFPAHDALLARYSHYARWRDTPADDPYWAAISPAAHLDAIIANAPAVLLIGGWYDSHLTGTLAAYRALAPHMPTRLAVGPWTHFPWDRRVGGLDFGEAAMMPVDHAQLAFFDRWLKDTPGTTPERGVHLFDMGAKLWRDLETLPDPTTSLCLDGRGRSAIDSRDGRLVFVPLAGDVVFDPPAGDIAERLTLDPWRPATPVGSTFGVPAGPIDRAASDARSDVLTFTTDPLTTPLLLAGAITIDIAVDSAAPSFDLHAVLSRIDATGAVWPLAEGFATLAPGSATLPMRATCCRLETGEALRLSISPAAFPAFTVNPGTGQPPWTASLADQRVTVLHVRCRDSRLNLPIHPVAQE